MVRSWKDQFHNREVSPVKLNQSWLDLGKIENKSKPADGQTDNLTGLGTLVQLSIAFEGLLASYKY